MMMIIAYCTGLLEKVVRGFNDMVKRIWKIVGKEDPLSRKGRRWKRGV